MLGGFWWTTVGAGSGDIRSSDGGVHDTWSGVYWTGEPEAGSWSGPGRLEMMVVGLIMASREKGPSSKGMGHFSMLEIEKEGTSPDRILQLVVGRWQDFHPADLQCARARYRCCWQAARPVVRRLWQDSTKLSSPGTPPGDVCSFAGESWVTLEAVFYRKVSLLRWNSSGCWRTLPLPFSHTSRQVPPSLPRGEKQKQLLQERQSKPCFKSGMSRLVHATGCRRAEKFTACRPVQKKKNIYIYIYDYPVSGKNLLQTCCFGNTAIWLLSLTKHSQTPASLFLAWRFDLHPKVFLKGYERRSKVRHVRPKTNLLVSVSALSEFSPSVMPFRLLSSFLFLPFRVGPL